jgi:hypothetical protein
MLGLRTIGASALGGLPAAANFVRTPAIVSVENNAISAWDRASIRNTLSSRSTAEVTIVDRDRLVPCFPGEDIKITWNDQVLFAGTIDQSQDELTDRNDDGDAAFTRLRCVDYSQLLDRFTVANAFLNENLASIVGQIVNSETLLFLEGVSLGEIPDTPELSKVVFNHRTVANIFRELGESLGLSWRVDFNKRVQFYDQATFLAPFTIGDLGRIDNRLYVRTRDRSQYRNLQIILAGFDLTDTRVENVRGDPTSVDVAKRTRTFPLAYEVGRLKITDEEVAKDPSLAPLQAQLGIRRYGQGFTGELQRIGTRNMSEDGDAEENPDFVQWFYEVGENEISKNSTENETLNPTLDDEGRLEVTYQGRFPIALEKENAPEIAERAAIEGGSGVYEHVDEDEDLDGRDLASEKADRLLATYGRIPNYFEFEMDQPLLEVGHLLDIQVADLGITPARQFMVDSLQIDFVAEHVPRTRYRLVDGNRLQGWSDFFRKWIERGKKTAIRENEVVVKTKRLPETLTIEDELQDSENDTVTLPDYDEDPYTFAMFGVVTVLSSGEEVPMFLVGRSRFGEPYGS